MSWQRDLASESAGRLDDWFGQLAATEPHYPACLATQTLYWPFSWGFRLPQVNASEKRKPALPT
jgi:hypothetical protein